MTRNYCRKHITQIAEEPANRQLEAEIKAEAGSLEWPALSVNQALRILQSMAEASTIRVILAERTAAATNALMSIMCGHVAALTQRVATLEGESNE